MDNLNEGQGIPTILDTETGRAYPLIAGGSDAPTVEGGEAAGDVQSSGSEEVQSGAGEETTGSEGTGGQGLIEPYLEDVSEEHQPVVRDVLERFRQEQDARVNERLEQRAQEIQQLQEEAEIPVTLYNSLINDPVGTITWVADRFEEEYGRDIRGDLLEQWSDIMENQQTNTQENQTQEGEQQDLSPEVVEQKVNELLEQRDQERQRQEQERQQQQEAAQVVNNWVSEAAESQGLELQDNDPLIPAIIQQAAALQSSQGVDGQKAIEMTVESFSKRFATSTSNNNNKGSKNDPNVADGGTSPPPENYDVSDEKQRRARMEELFVSPSE